MMKIKKDIIKLYKKTEEEKSTEAVLYCVSGFSFFCSLNMGPAMFLASLYVFLTACETTHKRKQNMLKIVHLSETLKTKSTKKDKDK